MTCKMRYYREHSKQILSNLNTSHESKYYFKFLTSTYAYKITNSDQNRILKMFCSNLIK